jgi:hypothetical protein
LKALLRAREYFAVKNLSEPDGEVTKLIAEIDE